MPALRAFVAVDLPPEMRREIGGLIESLSAWPVSSEARVRWVPAENLHVTLKFLGRVDPEQLPRLRETLDEVAAKSTGPLRLGVAGGGCFPDPARAKVLWLALRGDVGRLAELAAAVEQRLVSHGFPAEARAFEPHVTIGRLSGAHGARAVAEALVTRAPHLETDFLARELVLFRSETLHEGARYTALHRAPLGSPPPAASAG